MIASPSQENSVSVTTGISSLGSTSPTSGMEGGTTLKCVSFMRHSIAVHNEAAAACINAVDSVYLNEVYADSSLSNRGVALVNAARETLAGLNPPPDVVLCSPLTRAIQTAIAMFGGTGVRILAVPEVREAYGRFPCDRHRDRRELERMFGKSVDFSLCDATDRKWMRCHREEMAHLRERAAGFIENVTRRREGHIFVVSHGVFMEAAVRQLTASCPGYNTNTRVHNCEVHSFVFSVPSEAPTPAPPAPFSTAAPAGSRNGGGSLAGPGLASRSATLSVSATGAPVAALSARGSLLGRPGKEPSQGQRQRQPQPPAVVEAHLYGKGLVLACASGMPLQAIAHLWRVLRQLPNDGRGSGVREGAGGGGVCAPGLSEAQVTALLGRCGVGPDEARTVWSVLDREKSGFVPHQHLLYGLVAFYVRDPGTAGEPVGAGAGTPQGVAARAGLLELRSRYQAKLHETPLMDAETLTRVFQQVLSVMLSMRVEK